MRISDWSSDVCSSDLVEAPSFFLRRQKEKTALRQAQGERGVGHHLCTDVHVSLETRTMQTNILITGASRGIGAAIADALTTDATKVVALSSADGDLSDPATPDRLWQASPAKLEGRLARPVNNPAVFEANPTGRSPP